MSKTDFYSMVGTPRKTLPATFSGITYLDDDNTKQNRHGKWTLNNVTGSGLLYVDGDIDISGEFNWRGLVYLEGILDLSAPVWILGGLVEADPGTVAIQHKRATFLFSSDAIGAVGASGSVFTLSWREL
jgi:hypothetical protein